MDDNNTKILRTHLLQDCNSENAALELKKGNSNKTKPTLKKRQLIAHGHDGSQTSIFKSVIFSPSLFSTFLVY